MKPKVVSFISNIPSKKKKGWGSSATVLNESSWGTHLKEGSRFIGSKSREELPHPTKKNRNSDIAHSVNQKSTNLRNESNTKVWVSSTLNARIDLEGCGWDVRPKKVRGWGMSSVKTTIALNESSTKGWGSSTNKQKQSQLEVLGAKIF